MSTLEREKELLLERINDLGVSGGESYAYYLGGIDALNWVLSQEREGK